MFHSSNKLSLSFKSDYGQFRIEPVTDRENICCLCIDTPNDKSIELGHYCSISDAISAVAQQQTGHAPWDQLSAQELPHRVHNIVSWNFQQILGTLPRAACS